MIEPEIKLNIPVSKTLDHFVLKILPLIAPTFVFTLIKAAPSKPPITPRMIAAGTSSPIFVVGFPLRLPNLTLVPDHSVKLPFTIAYKRPMENVANEHDKNTFQIIINFQKVLGFDNS